MRVSISDNELVRRNFRGDDPLIVVIIGDQRTLAEQLAKLPVVIFGD
jgi:hypothetical protein